MPDATTEARRPKLLKAVVALSSSTFVLLAATIFLAVRVVRLSSGEAINTQRLLDQPQIRERVVQRLVDQAGGDYDSHPDPDVGRVMRPGSDKLREGIRVASNHLGLREREFELPKPTGTLRVVILGDSYVFGSQAPAEDRMGVFLEDYLRARGRGDHANIEVLHYGLISWNILAECAFLRRQLSLLQPDLVIHITVPNDVDDMYAVRGYGAMARFTTQHRERADVLIQYRHPRLIMAMTSINYLTRCLDYESRLRFERGRMEIDKLARSIEVAGGRYLHVLRWPGSLKLARHELLTDLRDDQVAYISRVFVEDERFWIAPGDDHWNRAGFEQLAKLFYGLIEERELLPMCALTPWPEAAAVVDEIHGTGLKEYAVDSDQQAFFDAWPIDERIDLTQLDDSEGPHFNGGVDAEGLVSPFASLALRRRRGTRLHLVGRALDRAELEGARVDVDVEEFRVGSFELVPGEAIDETWPLPEDLGRRKLLTVRLQSSDYVYVGDSLQHCVSFRLEGLSIER